AAGAAYRAIVRRNHHRQQRVELYPISLKDRLPTLSIPLRTTDRDVKLGLQSLLDQAYEDGRYDRTRYNRELEGGFDADDQKWIEELLRSAGKR
ncbi:MAG TPA: DUF4058 family protein, partial [Humisphaera sp.]|nr:DUF4058 family protein [Humisphaera sp.]